ncbi:MAG: aspartate aminotransferase, partial [Oscillospiraceae bacterium]
MKSDRIVRMTPSATIELEGTVADLRAKGINVIGLNAGEPDFNTPQNIIDACQKAMSGGKTRYCKVSGIQPL